MNANVWKVPAAAVVTLATASCSWIAAGEYCYCKVEAEGCDELEVTTEHVENQDQKDAEIPGL